MQKLSGASLRDTPPVLTRQLFPGQWELSRLLAAPLAVVDRLRRRLTGVDAATYTQAMRTQFALEPDASPFGGHDAHTAGRGGAAPLAGHLATAEGRADFWQRISERAGAVVHTTGHGVFVRAAEQDGAQIFVMHDPMFNGSTRFDGEAFARWAEDLSLIHISEPTRPY